MVSIDHKLNRYGREWPCTLYQAYYSDKNVNKNFHYSIAFLCVFLFSSILWWNNLAMCLLSQSCASKDKKNREFDITSSLKQKITQVGSRGLVVAKKSLKAKSIEYANICTCILSTNKVIGPHIGRGFELRSLWELSWILTN